MADSHTLQRRALVAASIAIAACAAAGLWLTRGHWGAALQLLRQEAERRREEAPGAVAACCVLVVALWVILLIPSTPIEARSLRDISQTPPRRIRSGRAAFAGDDCLPVRAEARLPSRLPRQGARLPLRVCNRPLLPARLLRAPRPQDAAAASRRRRRRQGALRETREPSERRPPFTAQPRV